MEEVTCNKDHLIYYAAQKEYMRDTKNNQEVMQGILRMPSRIIPRYTNYPEGCDNKGIYGALMSPPVILSAGKSSVFELEEKGNIKTYIFNKIKQDMFIGFFSEQVPARVTFSYISKPIYSIGLSDEGLEHIDDVEYIIHQYTPAGQYMNNFYPLLSDSKEKFMIFPRLHNVKAYKIEIEYSTDNVDCDSVEIIEGYIEPSIRMSLYSRKYELNLMQSEYVADGGFIFTRHEWERYWKNYDKEYNEEAKKSTLWYRALNYCKKQLSIGDSEYFDLDNVDVELVKKEN